MGWISTRGRRRAAAGVVVACTCSGVAAAQSMPSPVVRVHVASVDGPLAGVVVRAGAQGAETDARGDAVLRPAVGPVTILVRRIGVAPDSARLDVRAGLDTSLAFLLAVQAAVIAPVIVTSTRSERRVEDEPLRVEVLSGEDVREKTQMRPADLRLLLSEMSGVRVQTTSASLGAASVRVQGLRGRYTQILTDGLPLYGAQGGGFGLLQIPPLDLRQAEVLKGAASALYGAGALGGVLNLVSRRTPDSSEVLANRTSRDGSDLVGFGARQLASTVGVTALVGVHAQRAADVDGDGWSDIPGFRRIEVRPRLFATGAAGQALMVTAGAFVEQRGGGSMTGASTPTAAFPESLTTRHADVGTTFRARVSSAVSIAARAAANVQERTRRFGARREVEHASLVFGEVTSTLLSGAQTLLAGVSAQWERYRNADVPRFDEDRSTPALFVQHTYSPNEWLSAQFNGRCDGSSAYGTICTPRVSMLAHSGRVVSVRLSAGGGWAAPSALTEETEVFGLAPVAGPLRVSAERARTASLDVGATRGPLEVNATLFASQVRDPVGLRRLLGDTSGGVEFVNAVGPARVHGIELFGVYSKEPLVATAYFAATRSREWSPETGRPRESPYLPRESAGLDMAYEEDDSGTRVGVELYYTGPQALEDDPYRTVSPAYATLGVLVSRRIARANVYLNLENLTNVRQTRYDPLRRPSPGDGGVRTTGVWAPLDGRTANAGVRVQL